MTLPVPGALAHGGLRILLVLLLVQGSTAQTCNNGSRCASSITNCSITLTLNSCGAGTYSFLGCNTTTKYQCVCCPTGSNSPAATSSITGCTCNAGFGGNATGSPTCCTVCAPGTYKVAPGNTACTPCPANTTTASAGRTTISACTCDAGYGGNASTSAGCPECAPGFYKPASGNVACTACPPNSTNPPGPTSQTSCSCNAGYGGNALAGGCTVTKGVSIVSIILVLVAIVPEIHKCYQVREWSQRRKDELKKPGCEVCYKMTGCVLWWNMSAAKKYDFKYNFLSSFFLIVLSPLKLTGSSTTANAAQVNAILTILSTPCEFYDWWLLDFKSLDDDTDESETITTQRVVIGKIIGIIVAFVYLVYDTAKSALSDGSVIGVVAVAFVLNVVLLCLEAYTLRHTRARILQQQQMGQLAPLSGFLGFESACSGGAQFPPPQYNVPQQQQMGQEGPAGPWVYFDGEPAAPVRPQ